MSLSQRIPDGASISPKNSSHPAGFEPARGDPIGFQVQRLNHSATNACFLGIVEKVFTSCLFVQVEVIGGAEKYMAVCRRCFHSPTANIPASPRIPLKRLASNGNEEKQQENQSLPPKKALFVQEQELQEQENSSTVGGAAWKKMRRQFIDEFFWDFLTFLPYLHETFDMLILDDLSIFFDRKIFLSKILPE